MRPNHLEESITGVAIFSCAKSAFVAPVLCDDERPVVSCSSISAHTLRGSSDTPIDGECICVVSPLAVRAYRFDRDRGVPSDV